MLFDNSNALFSRHTLRGYHYNINMLKMIVRGCQWYALVAKVIYLDNDTKISFTGELSSQNINCREPENLAFTKMTDKILRYYTLDGNGF